MSLISELQVITTDQLPKIDEPTGLSDNEDNKETFETIDFIDE